jgi:predicted regulator of Ras-like GTPase activity (Roadblock/LC7/MglB family)
MPPETQTDDPLPTNPEERAKVVAIARRAFAQFNVGELTDPEVETMSSKSVLAGMGTEDPAHVLAKSGQLEF